MCQNNKDLRNAKVDVVNQNSSSAPTNVLASLVNVFLLRFLVRRLPSMQSGVAMAMKTCRRQVDGLI